MLPVGHAAVAYLGYLLYALVTRQPLALSWGLLPLAIGSQLPDLIDKPLAFYGLLPSGHSLGHSLFGALFCIGIVTWGAQSVAAHASRSAWYRHLAVAMPAPFSVGYLSHVLGDAIMLALARQYTSLTFVAWPLLPAPQYATDSVAPITRLYRAYQEPLQLEFALVLVVGLLFCILQVWVSRRNTTNRHR